MRTALSLLALFLIAGDDPPDRLRVEVTDAAGAPVAGAVVTLDLGYVNGKRAGPLARVETSSRGVAVLDGMPTDRAFHLTVDAGARGWATMKDLRWTLGGRVPVRLSPVRRVTGRVLELGPGGSLTPASGVTLTVWGPAHKFRRGTSAEDGSFAIDGVGIGSGWIELPRKTPVAAANSWWLAGVFPLPAGRDPPDLVVVRNGTISGRVVDAAGKPVAGAEVATGQVSNGGDGPRASPKSQAVRADAGGRFTIENVKYWQDRGTVHARRVGAGEGSVRLRGIPGTDPKDVVVTLGCGIPLRRWPEPPRPEPPPEPPRPEELSDIPGIPWQPFRGRVLDEAGRPVPLARLTYGLPGGGQIHEAVADPTGSFHFDHVYRAKDYVLRARAGERAIRKRRVLASEEKELTVVLHPGRSIAGRLIDEAGRPVPGSRVEAVRPEEEWFQTDSGRAFARTDADGRFRITGLHGDRWTLAVSEDQGYRGFLEDVAAGATDVVFPVRENHFESPFFLGGTLTVPKGRDPASYRLRAAPIGFRARPREGRPDAKGSFWINGTPPGLWRITVFEGDREVSVHGPAVCGETEFGIRIR